MNEPKFTTIFPWNVIDRAGLEVWADGIPICEIWQRGDEEQEKANARLIAAAPCLLESLAECLEIMNHGGTWTAEAQYKARAALKKATGEE